MRAVSGNAALSIVIRVAPGGASYSVFILDDSAETYRVTRTFGPFTSN